MRLHWTDGESPRTLCGREAMAHDLPIHCVDGTDAWATLPSTCRVCARTGQARGLTPRASWDASQRAYARTMGRPEPTAEELDRRWACYIRVVARRAREDNAF